MVASGNEDARPGTSGFAGDREDIISAQSLKRKTPTSPESIPTQCHLSGNNSKTEAFLQQVPITWKHLGDQGPEGTL